MVLQKWLIVPVTLLAILIVGISPAHADTIHVVQPGENLRRIAAHYGTTVPAILHINGLRDPDVVYIGQRLRIPTGEVDTYVVQPGDTLFSIARRLGVSQRALMQANGISNPSFVWVSQRLRIPKSGTSVESAESTRAAPSDTGYRVHVVGAGETLFSIATRHGVSVHSVVLANNLSSADRIVTGQRLAIPGGDTQPTVSVPTAGRWIDIDASKQRLRAYEGNQIVFSTVVSTGKTSTPTVLGRFAIRTKVPSQHMAGLDYNLPNVPWVMYFHNTYAIHGAYWHSDFGSPVSHGCVNMQPADAQWLYNWAPVGTSVVVHQ